METISYHKLLQPRVDDLARVLWKLMDHFNQGLDQPVYLDPVKLHLTVGPNPNITIRTVKVTKNTLYSKLKVLHAEGVIPKSIILSYNPNDLSVRIKDLTKLPDVHMYTMYYREATSTFALIEYPHLNLD